MRLKALDLARLLIAWATVVVFLIYGDLWLSGLGPAIKSAALFLWLLAIIA
jgi:Ca2+:H+ antiporter